MKPETSLLGRGGKKPQQDPRRQRSTCGKARESAMDFRDLNSDKLVDMYSFQGGMTLAFIRFSKKCVIQKHFKTFKMLKERQF